MESPREVVLFETELGWMALARVEDVVERLTFGHTDPTSAWSALEFDAEPVARLRGSLRTLVDRLERYAAGRRVEFDDVAVAPEATAFQQAVREACRHIRWGTTRSYAELAEQVGHPRAARAVGNVMRCNRVPLLIPCHRVVGSGGGLGGYSAPSGLDMKRRLLSMEGVTGGDWIASQEKP